MPRSRAGFQPPISRPASRREPRCPPRGVGHGTQSSARRRHASALPLPSPPPRGGGRHRGGGRARVGQDARAPAGTTARATVGRRVQEHALPGHRLRKSQRSAHHATRRPVRRLRPVRYPPRRDRRVEDDHVRLLRRPRRLPGDRIRQSRALTEPTRRFQKLQPRRKRRRRNLGSGRIVELRRRRRLRGARGHRQLRRRLRTRVVRRTTRLWVLASRASRTFRVVG